MQEIVTNMRGTRAFDKVTGRVLTLVLTASALGLSAVAPAQTPGVAFNSATRTAQAVHLVQLSPRHVKNNQSMVKAAESLAEFAAASTSADYLSQTETRPTVRLAEATSSDLTPLTPLRLAPIRVFPMVPQGTLRPATQASVAPAATPSVVKPVTGGSSSDVTVDFVDADISDVLKALSLQTHTNIVAGSDVKGNVTVSLAHVTLDNALNMISRLSGFEYQKMGSTYVVGTPASLALLMTGADSAEMQTAVVRYLYSNPEDLTTILKQVLPDIKLTSSKETGGAGGVFVMTGSPADIDQAKQIVQQTEQAMSKGLADDNTVVYNIKYSSAEDLQNLLGRMVPNLVVTPGPSLRPAPVAPTSADAGGITSTTTSYGSNTSTGPTVTSTTGNMPTKATTDSLLLSGTAADIAKAQTILAQVDLQPAQINFEAKITDLDVTLARDLGLGYSFAGANTTIGQVTSAGAAATTVLSTHSLPFGYTPLSQFVNVQLYADQTKGDARILASPNISAIDGQPAAIFIGDDVTYVSSITQGTTGPSVVTNTISAGIKLFITGKVDNDGYITVNLHPEVSTYKLTAAAGGTELPDISTREATTTLRVKDGDYIALGGLAENSVSKSTLGIPILSDIPVLGNLFRYDSKQGEQRELVIFIKVSIQKDGTVSAAPVPAG